MIFYLKKQKKIIDSHYHLDHEPLISNLDAIIARSKDAGITKILTICTTLESFEKIKPLIHKYENIYGTFGIHPHETKKFTEVNSQFIINIKNYL